MKLDYMNVKNQWDPFEIQERIEERQKQKHIDAYIDQLERGQAFTEGSGREWEQSLKEAGLTQAEYNQVFEENQSAVKDAIARAMRRAAADIAARAKKSKPEKAEPKPRPINDPRTGKFVSPRDPRYEKIKQYREQTMEELKQKAKRRYVDE